MKHIFKADDGNTFTTAAVCKAYEENKRLGSQLAGLLEEQVWNALTRTDTDLADAIERAGHIIAAKRRESGELKRKAKTDLFKGIAEGEGLSRKP